MSLQENTKKKLKQNDLSLKLLAEQIYRGKYQDSKGCLCLTTITTTKKNCFVHKQQQ